MRLVILQRPMGHVARRRARAIHSSSLDGLLDLARHEGHGAAALLRSSQHAPLDRVHRRWRSGRRAQRMTVPQSTVRAAAVLRRICGSCKPRRRLRRPLQFGR